MTAEPSLLAKLPEVKPSSMVRGRRDLTGQRFGRLLVIGRVPSVTRARFLCRCDCGNERAIYGIKLVRGHTRSCGCFRRESAGQIRFTHGDSRRIDGKTTGEYGIWRGLRQRCSLPTTKSYKYYGARGIKVCDRWTTYENFLADMGRRPTGGVRYTIERIDNDGHYSCGKCSQCQENGWKMNCKWATYIEQARNRRPPSLNA